MIRVLTSIALSVFVFSVSAQQEEQPSVDNGLNHGIGLGGPILNTGGFAYRHHFKNGFGIASSIGMMLTANYGYLGNSLGLLYNVHHFKFSSSRSLPHSSLRTFLLLYATHVFNMRDRHDTYSFDYGIGPGFGAEYFFNQYIAVNLELAGMTVFSLKDKKIRFSSAGFNPGIGIVVYF